MDKYAIVNATVYQANGETYQKNKVLNNGILIVEGERIHYVGKDKRKLNQASKIFDACYRYLVPGAVDSHIHGILEPNVGNVTEGIWNPEKNRFYCSKEDIERACLEGSRIMARHGTTSCIFTTMATTETRLKRSLECISGHIGEDTGGADIAGIAIEGSFLYPDKRYIGAQNPKYFHQATIDNYKRLIEAFAGDKVKWVGVDPRWSDSPQLIKYLTQKNIAIEIGHSGASKEQFLEALKLIYETGGNEQGGLGIIHLYNGPVGNNHKPRYGQIMQAVVPAVLFAEKNGFKNLFAELILDGEHHSASCSLEALLNFGSKNLTGITDNIGAGQNLRDKYFKMAGVSGKIDDKYPLAIWVNPGVTLFGSRATTMDHMFPYILKILKGKRIYGERSRQSVFGHELSFDERINIALDILCATPARIHKLDDRGTIEKGKYADFVILDIDNEENVKVEKVFVRGKEVKWK